MVYTNKNKKGISFFLASTLMIIILGLGVFSCGKDVPESETVNFQVDFLVNDMDVPSLEEYSTDDLLVNDSLYSLKIQAGSLVKLMDITNHSDKIEKWEWSLKPFGSDENIEGKKVLANTKEFEYRPAEEGRFVIELWINGSKAGTGKIIDVLEELDENYAAPFEIRNGEYVQNSGEIEENPSKIIAEITPEEPTSYEPEEITNTQEKPADNQSLRKGGTQSIPNDKPDVLASKGDRATITPPKYNEPSKPPTTTYVKPPSKPIAKPEKLPVITTVFFKRSAIANVGEKVTFEDTSKGDIINERTWDFGDGSSPVTKNSPKVSHTFNKADTYTIKLCLNNSSDKCISRTIKIIKKPDNKPLFSNIDFTVPKTIYKGESISITDKSSPAKNILNRYWDFGDGAPSRTAKNATVSYKYNKVATYDITLCLNNKGGEHCVTKKIKVIEKPAPEKPKEPEIKITSSDIVLNAPKKSGDVGESFSFSDKTTKKVSKRQWFIDGQLIGSGQTLSHSFKKAGTYKVKLCVEGNNALCKDVSISIKEKKAAPQVADPLDIDVPKKGTASYASSSNCNSATKKTEGIIKLAITKPTLLDEMTVVTDAPGEVTVILSYKSTKGNTIKDSISKSVNLGKTQVGLSDFGVVLMPNTTFSISIRATSGINLLDSSSCGGTASKGQSFSLSGAKGLVHDLKYYHE